MLNVIHDWGLFNSFDIGDWLFQSFDLTWFLLVHLAGNLLRSQNLVKDVRDFFATLFVSKDLPLVDAKEELDVKTVNVLVQVLSHRVPCFAQCQKLQEWVLTLKFPPIGIGVAA